MTVLPVSSDAEIILTARDLGAEGTAHLINALQENYLAWGHRGWELSDEEKNLLREGPWSLQRVPLNRLIRPEKRRDFLNWIQAEEDEWGIYPYIPQPNSMEELLENPIILGPIWAFPWAEEHTGMKEYTLLDGFHRTGAAIRAGQPFLDVFVTQPD